MNSHHLAICCLIAAAASSLTAREFTDVQGRKLEAELLSVSAGQATLKRASDGRSFVVPVTAWSPDDQKFMNEFAESNAKYSFEVKYSKKKMGETSTKVFGGTDIVEKWAYKVTLRNQSSLAANGVTAHFWLFRKDFTTTGRTAATMQASGTVSVSDMARNSTVEVVSPPVDIKKAKNDPGYGFTNGNFGGGQRTDQMGGFAIKLVKNGKVIHQYATDPDYLAVANVP